MSPHIPKSISCTLPSILYYVGIVLILVAFIGYTLFQARFLIEGPKITFYNPQDTVQTHRLVTLEGRAQNIMNMTLNGRAIYTDENGYFKEALVLENGYTVATIQVHDRYKHSRSYIKEFVYTPALTSR